MQFFIFCAAEGRVLKSCVSIRVFFVECSVLFFAFSSLFLQCLPKVSVGLGEPARDLQLFKKILFFRVTVLLSRLELESSQVVEIFEPR